MISLTGIGQYEAGPLGIITQSLTNLADGTVDAVVGVEENALSPNLLDDLLMRGQLPAAFHQKDQELHRNGLELEGDSAGAQFLCAHVQLEIVPEPEATL